MIYRWLVLKQINGAFFGIGILLWQNLIVKKKKKRLVSSRVQLLATCYIKNQPESAPFCLPPEDCFSDVLSFRAAVGAAQKRIIPLSSGWKVNERGGQEQRSLSIHICSNRASHAQSDWLYTSGHVWPISCSLPTSTHHYAWWIHDVVAAQSNTGCSSELTPNNPKCYH